MCPAQPGYGLSSGWRDFAVEWEGGSTATCTVRVYDEISGLDVDSARYRLSTDGGVSWRDWSTATCTGISGTTEMQTVTAAGVPFESISASSLGQPRAADNRIEFQIADMKGYTGTAAYTVPSEFVYLPLVVKD